ncbi:Quinate/shikimate dehydrogenase [Xylophilus ampelinus]|nr:shikimate dehydrogenase [Variovorax sp.]VTY38045.1 Quinate/shikimate dehydrogenase [Xylophilus ampelinus]
MADIHGNTDLYLIPGDPVTNVRLPRMFNAVFERCGIDAVMVPVQVRARDFAVWLKASFLARNVKGMVIAPPHKPLAVDLLDGCGLFARIAGSVNVVRRTHTGDLEGDLFDGEGIVGALDRFGILFRGQRVLILGAGVSAAAVGVSLAEGGGENGARHIAFHDPAPGKSAGVAARIDAAFDATVVVAQDADPSGYDLVINATSLGLKPDDPLPCDVARMAPHAALFDILLRNQPTPLVQAARARGLQAQPGFEMLIQQMSHYMDYFGLHEAAEVVREDADFIRELIYPPALAGEIRLPVRHPGA